MPFMGLAVYSSAPDSTILAMAPPDSRDKNQVEVYDLRSMKRVGVPIRGEFGGFNQKFAVSPDGAYFATIQPKAPRAVVEVFSSATGRSVRSIEVDADPQMKVSMFDFVWDEHLITLKHKGEFVDFEVDCTYQVWDLKTGAESARFGYDLRFLPRWGAFTPGRRYMVMEHTSGREGFHILFWDLRTGERVGDLEFQGKGDPWGQASGLAFTPDGEKMALLWRLAQGQERSFRLFCFDVKTGAKLREAKIANESQRGEYPWLKGGPSSVQWVPDGSGLLLFGHLLVDYESGAVVSKVGPEPKSDLELVERRFLDRDHVTTLEGTTFKKNLAVLTLPRAQIDANAKKARDAAAPK
jgi:WD40 repeat protein